MILKN